MLWKKRCFLKSLAKICATVKFHFAFLAFSTAQTNSTVAILSGVCKASGYNCIAQDQCRQKQTKSIPCEGDKVCCDITPSGE